jgi:diguanylate cyclase (GGDEF)-like protein/PAS domain S-box-containing protein
VIGTIQDVSARKAQEEALRVSEERFRSAIGAMHDGLVVQNEHAEILVCNPQAEAILGLTAEQMAGRTSLDPRWRAIHPDGSDWPGETHPATVALATGEAQWDRVMGVHKPDGVLTWISINASPLTRAGESLPYAVVTTFADVTERRRLEGERERMTREAIERADRDPLTNLYNHRTFHHRLRVESTNVAARGDRLAVIVMDMDNFKFFNDTYGHLVGDEVLMTVADALREATRDGDTLARIGGDEFALLLPRATREEAWDCAARLRDQVHGLRFQPTSETAPVPLRLSVGIAVFPDETASFDEAVYIADKRAMQDKTGDLPNARYDDLRRALNQAGDGFSMLDALVAAVDNKDRYTRKHSEDVMVASGLIAREMGLTEDFIRSLEVAALLHDVGKIGVPVSLLRRPGHLNAAETAAVRQHATLGAMLVGAVPELSHTLPAVRHHHEAWDGTGYPDGLRGEEIPLSARIMAVADAFSALTTDRPYRPGRSTDEALAVLAAGAGVQWDAACVRAFLDLCGRMSHAERERTLYRRETLPDAAPGTSAQSPRAEPRESRRGRS